VRALTARLAPAWAEFEAFWLAPADPRAYAALRIGYAVAALFVLGDLWPIRHALLAETGLFGGASAAFLGVLPNPFFWVRGEGGVTALVSLVGAAAASLAVGFQPRAAAFCVFYFMVALVGTAPTAQSGFDEILRVIGFVLVVSPQVRTWTLGRKTVPGDEPPVYGLRLVQFQLLLIYASTVWLKAPDPFWRSGEAVGYFMMSMFSRFPDAALARLPVLSGVLTFGTLLVEIAVPFLLWMPRTRWLGLLLGGSLHVGIALSSHLALFTLTILPLYVAFLERRDFDRVAAWFGAASSQAPDPRHP
jgi:hypothetical protein